MSILEKLARDLMESIWPTPSPSAQELLQTIRFSPAQQQIVISFAKERELDVDHMLRLAVYHYMSRFEPEPEIPPADFSGQAPSFAKPQSVFAEKEGEVLP